MANGSHLNKYIEKASDHLGLSVHACQLLSTAYREIRVQIPVRMDNGDMQLFFGYRVQHNGALGPYKGGIRFHPEVELDEVRDLASAMTWKNALMQLPLGGAKGGVVCDPWSLSMKEKEKLMRGFASKISLLIGPHRDIPAPDMNTNATMMAWIMDEYGKKHGHTPAVVTGKPLELGGSLGRNEATGRGAAFVLGYFYKDQGTDPAKTTGAVQGFGNVGYHIAKYMQEMGISVVAISNHKGGVYKKDGFDLDALKKYELDHDFVMEGFPDSEPISNEDLLALDVDCLAPSALGHIIHKDNVQNIKAKVILECANLPLTYEAEQYLLSETDAHILPDVLVNAGGVTVSYFEWVQNLQQMQWSKEQVDKELDKKMFNAYSRMKARVDRGSTWRDAAYYLGVERVSTASKLRSYL